MHRPQRKPWLATTAALLFAAMAALGMAMPAAAQPAPPSNGTSGQFVDGIAAIVDKDVITLGQVRQRAQVAQRQLQEQGIPVPPPDILQRQVLQRMIMQKLQEQEAERLGIRVSNAQVQRAVATVAERNKLTPEQLKKEIAETGVSWEEYLAQLRQELQLDLLRQRAVDSTIVISEAEVDAFLKTQGAALGAPQASRPGAGAGQPVATGPELLGLAQIVVVVPEGAAADRERAARQKAEALLAQIKAGADFAGVAAAESDGPEALEGGELGLRPVEGWPDLFIQATQGLQAGDVSDIVRSGNGFHILKVLSRGPARAGGQAAAAPSGPPNMGAAAPGAAAPQPNLPEGPMMVTQTHARHILVRVTPAMSDEQAHERVRQLRQRLAHGESFEDLAKRYSDDATAPQGGDLGWLTPGETVPAFEQAMDHLQPNEISEPVRSQFGWHLIQVLDRRTKNMEEEYRRMRARQILFERRIGPAFEDWLNQLRGQAYVDNRLEPDDRSAGN